MSDMIDQYSTMGDLPSYSRDEDDLNDEEIMELERIEQLEITSKAEKKAQKLAAQKDGADEGGGDKKKKKKKALPGEEIVAGEGDAAAAAVDDAPADDKIDKKKKKKAFPSASESKVKIIAGNDLALNDSDSDGLDLDDDDTDLMRVNASTLTSRFYENQYPEIESLVMVNVRHIAEMGAYVSLLEYNGIEGMILLSELSRRRIRSINKLIRVNRNEVVMVLRVDREKGYIDLSKRRVSPEDIQKCEDKYNKAKAVHSVLRHLADTRKLELKVLYETIGWPLYKKYGHAYDAFKITLANDTPDKEDPFLHLPSPIDPSLKTDLLTYIKRRLAPQPIKIRADIEVSCFSYEGIDAIREALMDGINVGEKGSGQVKIKLIAPPIYVMSCMTLDKDIGIDLLTRSILAIQTTITAKSGKMEIKMPPKAVSLREENELQQMMERLAQENEEVDGDEPEEEGV